MSDYRYSIKRVPGGLLRVVDLEKDRVDGVWFQEEKEFLDFSGWLDQ